MATTQTKLKYTPNFIQAADTTYCCRQTVKFAISQLFSSYFATYPFENCEKLPKEREIIVLNRIYSHKLGLLFSQI